jgi:hypothetical protein
MLICYGEILLSSRYAADSWHCQPTAPGTVGARYKVKLIILRVANNLGKTNGENKSNFTAGLHANGCVKVPRYFACLYAPNLVSKKGGGSG